MHELLGQLPAVIYEYQINPERKGSFKFVSDSSLRLIGKSAQELINDPAAIDSVIHPDDLVGFFN